MSILGSAPWLVSLLVLGAPPSDPKSYLPCHPGLTVIYKVEDQKDASKDTGVRIKDVVRGSGKQPRTCIIDRETIYRDGRVEKDAYLRELLDDRVTYAGWLDTPTAFRPPLLIAPLKTGRRWHFNRTDFVIKDFGATFDVPAGTIQECIRVERSMKRPNSDDKTSYTVYAPGIGVVISMVGSQRQVAIEISGTKNEPKGRRKPKSSPTSDR